MGSPNKTNMVHIFKHFLCYEWFISVPFRRVPFCVHGMWALREVLKAAAMKDVVKKQVYTRLWYDVLSFLFVLR
jgi:hypothetical protein